jgi:tRNA pseudouridine13 synthase
MTLQVQAARVKPTATLRLVPEDFVVQEIPAFLPSGSGEHLFLWITKTDVTTEEAVRRICQALHVDARGAGYAGMKDRRAVATQMVSVPFASDRAESEATRLDLEGISVASATRHQHKLKPGHLKGNRFTIVLRDLPAAEVGRVQSELEKAGTVGVPNAFGAQRFGRDGDNPQRALAWLSGRTPGPRDRRERRLLFSALQAHLFNRVLEVRRAQGTWTRPLVGDLMKKHDTGGIFMCSDADECSERAGRGEICPTGPIFGAKMRWPEGEPARIEREVLAEMAGEPSIFAEHRALGEGSRRPFTLRAEEFSVEKVEEHAGALRVHFVLPKGCYATTLLATAVALHEPMPCAVGVRPHTVTR